MATFTLEVRTEEIPAAALPDARRQLESGFAERLAAAGYGDASVTALSTNRRLAVQVAGLPERQADRTERVTGPPVRVAFSDDGVPTPAAEGFARKVGIDVASLERESTDKGEYLAATVTVEGRRTAEVMAEIARDVVTALRFPKTMRWGLGEHVFVRPVHGVVALLDDALVELELFGVTAGRTTVGHRVHSPEPFDVGDASRYASELEARSVLVDPTVRRERLSQTADRLAAEVGCRVHPDPELVAEHVELVEYPHLLSGGFSERFLDLPPEVVITTLRHHQKCLVLERADGELAPFFLAVVDRRDDPQGLIRQGNEWVIGARLADAGFFFAEDRKRRLDDLAPGLSRLEFHRTLGSLEAKAERVGRLAGWIDDVLACEAADLTSAAKLVKSDLLTHMVGEFPELQGVMGGHYLRLEGADAELWTAARDHYRPSGFEGAVPESVTGRLIGLADRLDTVVGLFAVGEQPTGSKDPFGLRRAAQGAVKIAAEAGWDLDLGAAVARAAEAVAPLADADPREVTEAVSTFLVDRVRRYLVDVAGVAGDTADAVLAADWTRVPSAVERARALETARATDRFRMLSLAFKRVRNITDGQPDAAVDDALFEHDAERRLSADADSFRERLDNLLANGRVDEAFAAMEPLAETLDRFFVDVLVMADDDRIRTNRIALLKFLGRDFLRLADLSKLQIEGGD